MSHSEPIPLRKTLDHGYHAQTLPLLAYESPEGYLATRESYFRIYRPRTEEEADLVADIVNSRWRLRRIEAERSQPLSREKECAALEASCRRVIYDSMKELRTLRDGPPPPSTIALQDLIDAAAARRAQGPPPMPKSGKVVPITMDEDDDWFGGKRAA